MNAAPGLRVWLRSTGPRGLATCAVAGLLAGGAVLLWSPPTGVILLPVEGSRVAAVAGVAAALVCAALRWLCVPASAAVLVPVAALEAFRWVGEVGSVEVRTDRTHAAAVLVAVACAAALARRWPRSAAVILGILSVGSAVAQLRTTTVPRLDRSPIVLLTLDTVRADHIAGFGGEVDIANTPALDRFFKSARVFRHAYATQPITGPSHTSMLSGLDVQDHGVNANGAAVPSGLAWVPEELQRAGWRTRAAVSAAVLDSSLRFDRGFDAYDSAFDSRLERAFPFLNWRGFRPAAGTATSRWGASTLEITGSFPRGSFTWVHLYDAHWPYTPSPLSGHFAGLDDVTPLAQDSVGRRRTPTDEEWPPDLVQRGKALYRAELSDLDMIVRRLLDRVPADATVIIAGDHGESLDEHHYVFAHGRLPFAPDVRTVLAVRSPGVAPAWMDTPVSLRAVADTLRAAAGLPTPDGSRGLFDAPSGAPVVSVAYMKGAGAPHALGPLSGVAVREGARASVWTRWDEPGSYDVVADPRELRPAALEPADAAHLRALADRARPAAAAAPEMHDALEALGYLTPDDGATR